MEARINSTHNHAERREGSAPRRSNLRRVYFALAVLAIVALTMFPVSRAAAATLTIETKTLPNGYLNSPYSLTLTATGGSGKGYVWSVKTGTLPVGTTLSSAGVLSGKPTVETSYSVTIQVRDSLANVATAPFTIVIKPALAIKAIAVPKAYVGTEYSLKFETTGGSGTGLTWSVVLGSLPKGLVLSTAGIIAGKPTVVETVAVAIEVKDSAGNTAKITIKLIVGPHLSITTAGPLPVGYVDTNYNFTFAASGGSGTGYTWTTKSQLPGSFGLSKAGVLYGLTPTAETVVLVINVTDSAKNTASAEFKLVIDPAVTQCASASQDSADFSELHGVYTFIFNRRNLTTGQLFYSIGSFDASGDGTISSGVMDSNGPGFTAATQSTFTGTYIVDADGRGRMDITIPVSSSQTLKQSFCFALDSFAVIKNPKNKAPQYGAAAHAFVLEDDASNVTSSGELLAQAVTPSNSIMQGSFAFGLTGRNHFPTLLPNGPDPRVAFAGYLDFDGMGTLSGGEMDEVISNAYGGAVVAPDYRPKQSLAGTYSIPSSTSATPTGRGTMSVTHNGVTFAEFVFYPYGGATNGVVGVENLAAGVVVLEINAANDTTTPVHPTWVGTGARRTLTTFSATSLSGGSVASQSFVDNPGTINESEAVGIDLDLWNGAGSFSYTGDRNAASVPSTTSGKGTYTVDANGRFAIMVNGLCAPCGYLTGQNQGFGIYDSEGTNLVLLENQTLPELGGPFGLSSILGAYSFGNREYAFAQQQTATGETVTRGDGNFTGTIDTDTMGKSDIDISQTALETTTSTSGTTGRFLYQPSNTAYPYAIYVIDATDAVAIPLGGSDSETDPLLRFIHQ